MTLPFGIVLYLLITALVLGLITYYFKVIRPNDERRFDT
jgi:hypothetical protein